MSRLLIATQQQLPASHASPERPRSHFSLQDVHDLPPRQPRSTFLAVGSPFTHHPNNRSTHSLPHASSPVSPLPQTFVSCYHQRQYVPPIYFPMRHHHLLQKSNWVPPTTADVPTLLCGVLPWPLGRYSVTPYYRPGNASPQIRNDTGFSFFFIVGRTTLGSKPRGKTPDYLTYSPAASSGGEGSRQKAFLILLGRCCRHCLSQIGTPQTCPLTDKHSFHSFHSVRIFRPDLARGDATPREPYPIFRLRVLANGGDPISDRSI
ncbi:hypothetical protein CTAM01_03509 [Colletotrichum tamarilloi]|uniref:Uncharacterized protein n=1 Tax=Colletotrichum tamarilloi TaxID=1209934 RepID=A0ABQ9RKL3_9PEZI|nr:uncharacterized protein CTAM01_03509 [Colletotrichum tamarilloi]KAK1506174.1 hypothetical protein CTAM01_03509 [Colletotrichum tamarilloi]